MIFTLRLLGLEVLHIELSQPDAAASDEDFSRDLSGGATGSYPIQVTHRYGMEPEPYWPDEDE